MTTSAPWAELPTQVADVLEPELPAIADAILRAIGEEVPEYARPLEGAFGRDVRTGVTRALERFNALVRDPDAPDEEMSRVYVALGREELRAGRTLDALQSAYRIGARVAWRHTADVSARAGFDHDVITRLAEAIFAYIDELSAESIEGYARAQSELAGERERLGNELVEALLGAAAAPEVHALAERLGWVVPRTAAAVACPAPRTAGLARRLGPEVLATVIDGTGCLVVPDAEGPGRPAAVRAAASGRPAAIGPELPLERLADSWRLASVTLSLHHQADGLVAAEDHLSELLVLEGGSVVEQIARHRLGAFDDLTPKARERMAATALAYVQHQGNAAAMARALHIHPQTARYRINGLRELLGDQLDDPDGRFELEAALRSLVA
jgi:PucR C-terminal helix-turn-helix domain